MITKYLQEIIGKLNRAEKVQVEVKDGNSARKLKITGANYSPISYDDVVIELSNGKNIYAKDLEFANETNDGNLELGVYSITLS